MNSIFVLKIGMENRYFSTQTLAESTICELFEEYFKVLLTLSTKEALRSYLTSEDKQILFERQNWIETIKISSNKDLEEWREFAIKDRAIRDYIFNKKFRENNLWLDKERTYPLIWPFFMAHKDIAVKDEYGGDTYEYRLEKTSIIVEEKYLDLELTYAE